ncbi:MAG: alpha/beta fold hydrolase [Gammaproteobacteria bacterium]
MATFVLVHGASHGGWCWYKVAAHLRSHGHRVHAPDLPGHGADRSATDQASMQSSVDRIGETLQASSEPAILVGHSMGGAVISQAAEQYAERISHLVYLCAFLLEANQSIMDVLRQFPEATDPPVFVPLKGTSYLVPNPEQLAELFYADCTADDIALAQALLVPQNPELFVAPIQISDSRFGGIPRTYIECTQDRAIPLKVQRHCYRHTPCQTVISLDTSHSPFLSQPAQLADVLTQVAQ